LAFLVLRGDPRRGPELRKLIEPLGPQPTLAAVGQALVRAKQIAPQDYLRLQGRVEAARQTCPGCRGSLVVFSHVPRPCARCGTPIGCPKPPPREREPARTRRDSSRNESDGGLEPARLPKKIGAFPILRRIGQGGMGTIYLARDAAGREVALKRLLPGVSEDSRERFRREAEAIARLKHPGIVAIHDVGLDPETRLPFYTMDYVAGHDLSEIKDELSREALLEMIVKVARGLHYAHQQGILHRDVKPQNILVDETGEPRLADFGLARDLARSALTEDGDLVGTPLFMSPEQLAGETERIDHRSDIYALGVLLYEALTGSLPIEAGSFFELQDRVKRVVPAPPSSRAEVPKALDRIVLKALEKEADDRYASAEALALDLERHLRGESVEASAVSPWKRARRGALLRLRSPWLWVGVFVLVLLGLLTGGAILQWRAARREAEARAALESRREVALNKVRQAQEALEAAQGETEPARILSRLEEVEARTAAAQRASKDLGRAAPAHLERDLEAVRVAAARLGALTRSRGDVAQRHEALLRLRALLRDTGDPDLRLNLGRLELEAGHYEAALAQLDEVLKRSGGKEVEAFYYRAEAHRRMGTFKFAILDYGRALAERDRLVGVRPARVLVGKCLAQLASGELSAATSTQAEAKRIESEEPHLFLCQAAFRSQRGDAEGALKLLVFGSRAFPQQARLHEAAGRVWARLGDAERARAEFEAALRYGLDPGPRVAKGRLAALAGRDEAARSQLQPVLAESKPADPVRSAGSLALARLERAQGRRAEALAILEPLLSARPSWRVRLEAGELLVAGDDPEGWGRAEELARGLSDSNPRSWTWQARARRILVRAALRRGKLGPAWELLQPSLGTGDAESLTLAADILQARGEAAAEPAEERALEAQRLAVNAAGGLDLDVGDPLEEALSCLLRGRRLVARSRRQAADDELEEPEARGRAAAEALGLDLLRRATRLAPWLASARQALGQALSERGEAAAALQAIGKGRATTRALRLRAALWAAQNDHQAALRDLERALDRAPQTTPSEKRLRARLLLARARSRLALGRSDEALEDLDQAGELDGLLLEVFAERARLRTEAGNDVGAEEDRTRVFLLREGYVRRYESCRLAAWRAGLGPQGNHVEALRVLKPAFEVVSRERDPERRAELHLVRAYMRLRSLRVAGALIDLAAMLELGPARSFRQIYDEVVSFRGSSRMALRLEPIVERVLAQRDVQDEVDPDFLQAFSAFVTVEFAGDPCPQSLLRAGLAAADRYLERRPAHVAAHLLRAALLLADDRAGAALAAVQVALEEPTPQGYAHFLLARIQVRQRDALGGLRSLERAVSANFDVFQRIEEDQELSSLRALPRYPVVLAVAQAGSALRLVRRGERIALSQPPAVQRQVHQEMLTQLGSGLGYLREHLDEQEAQVAAAEVYFVRARISKRLSDRKGARRDLVAALELDPRLLRDLRHVAAAYRALAPVTASGLRGIQPKSEERFPSELREAIPVVLNLLLGGDPPSSKALKRAARLVETEERTRSLLSVIRLGQGETQAALRAAREASQDTPALAAWFEARALLADGKTEPAFLALRRAREAGLRGPLQDDPALESVAGEERFQLLFPKLPLGRSTRWR
jgi:serine/threonine protein kinase